MVCFELGTSQCFSTPTGKTLKYNSNICVFNLTFTVILKVNAKPLNLNTDLFFTKVLTIGVFMQMCYSWPWNEFILADKSRKQSKTAAPVAIIPYVDTVVDSGSQLVTVHEKLKKKLNYFANSSESKATICLTHGFDSPALSGALKQLQTLTHQISWPSSTGKLNLFQPISNFVTAHNSF